MDYTAAQAAFRAGKTIYRAYWDGHIWSAGGMRDVGETIGYYETEEEARKACDDYMMIDFDRTHCTTDVERCDAAEFES